MKVSEYLWTIVVFVMCLSSSHAEEPCVDIHIPDSNYVQKIKTYSGMTVIGRIEKIDSASVDFTTSLGKLTISVSDIYSLEDIPLDSGGSRDTLEGKKEWFPNPNATRLFFSPTGRMLKKGEGYFADYYVLLPMVAYGITDWLGIGGGISLIPFVGIQSQILYLMPRVGLIQTEKFAWSAGILAGAFPIDIGVSGAGIVYTTATYGSLDASFTCGTGYGFILEDAGFEGMQYPMLMFGGEARMGRRISFVSENWLIPEIEEDLPLIASFGLRFFGEQMSVDLGFINPIFTITYGEGIFPGIPYVDFVYNF